MTTAVHRLAYEGLVLIEPQKGSYVSRIQLDDVLQWMLLRRAIEAEVAGEAARRLDPDAREALRRNLRYQEAAIAGADHDGFLALDVAFHELLTDGLGLNRVAEILGAPAGRTSTGCGGCSCPSPAAWPRRSTSTARSRTAIERRKARAAEQAMRRHLDVVMERLTSFERDHPDFFGA